MKTKNQSVWITGHFKATGERFEDVHCLIGVLPDDPTEGEEDEDDGAFYRFVDEDEITSGHHEFHVDSYNLGLF
jgi:hypothetical protein